MKIKMLPLLLVCMPISSWGNECAEPVALGKANDPLQWYSLADFNPQKSLNSEIREVQDIYSTGSGDINNDFYAITINSGRYSAESLFREIRSDLSTVIFGVSSTEAKPNYEYSLNYYNSANRSLWESGAPKGAVMSFTLALIPFPLAEPLPYRGSVVLSCISVTSFIFSTVETRQDGWHPVSGNRSFGVSTLPNGSLQIWTKGADRAVSKGILGVAHLAAETAREATFGQGHKVWVNLLTRLEHRYRDLSPRDRIEFSVRRPYSYRSRVTPSAPSSVDAQ